MTKINKKNLLLTFAALLCVVFAALMITVPKHTVKATEQTTTDYRIYNKQEDFIIGAEPAGKLLVISGDLGNINSLFCLYNPTVYWDRVGNKLKAYDSGAIMQIQVFESLSTTEIAVITETTGIENISIAIIFPTTLWGRDLTGSTIDVIVENRVDYHLFANDGEEINPLPNETENKFDLSEWLHNAGNDVSAWLGDNVGISVSGGTLLIVGGVILFFALRRRRR